MKKNLLLLFFAFGLYTQASAQPANNDCGSPTPLTVGGGICNNTLGTNVDATPSGESPDPGCSSFGTGEDVWYSIVVPGNGIVNVEMSAAGGPTDWAMSIYSGSCGALAEVECDDDDGPGLFPLIELTGRTPGEVLLVRVWEYANDLTGDFNICASTQSPCPYVATRPNAGTELVLSDPCTSGDNTGTGEEANEPEGSCFNGGTQNSVWYKVTGDGSETTVTTDFDGGTNDDTEVAVYTATDGGDYCTFTQVGCDQDGGTEGSGWLSVVNFPTDIGVTYYVQVSGYNGTEGTYCIAAFSALAPLPVELSSFTGKTMEKSNMLMWETAAEENTQFHIIERSLDGRSDWTEVGRVDAVGFTNQTQNYSLEDTRPMAKSYYRLRSVDFDAYEDVSDVIYLERKTDRFDLIGAYPVPVKNQLTVDFEVATNQEVEIRLTDMLGHTIQDFKHNAVAGINSRNIDMAKMASGVYFVTINNGNEQMTKRIVKN